MITIRTHRMGVLKRKKSTPPTKAQYAKAFGRQLYDALQKRVTELRQLDQQNFVDQNLTGPIQTFWNEALKVHDTTARLGSRITNSLMIEIEQLHKSVDEFDVYTDQHFECHTAGQLLLGMSLADLCEDVRHFVQQIALTSTSLAADKPLRKLPNRPTDWEKKELFLQEISAHQLIHGPNTYPRHNILERRMASKGYKLPERTYRDWRMQHRAGKFAKLVQDR